MPPHVIGYYCIIVGVSMLAGWWTAFRNRPYLALLGLFFLALAASLNVADRLQVGPKTAGLQAAWWAAVVAAVLLFLAATVSAVGESRRRWREMRAHYQAASEALLEMAKAKQEQQRRQAEQAASGESPEAKPDGEDGRATDEK